MILAKDSRAREYLPPLGFQTRVLEWLQSKAGELYTWREIAYYMGLDPVETCKTVENLMATGYPGLVTVVLPSLNWATTQWQGFAVGFNEVVSDNNSPLDGDGGYVEGDTQPVEATAERVGDGNPPQEPESESGKVPPTVPKPKGARVRGKKAG